MTSIPPSSAVPPSAATPAAPATPAAGSTGVLTQLPEAVRSGGPGTVISGTVLGRDPQGQTLLQTNAGVVGLRTAAQLAVGTQITLQIQAAGSQLQAVLLSAIAPKPGAATGAAARAAPAPAGGGPAATLNVSAGPVLTATVISPQTGGPIPGVLPAPPAPPGSAPPAAAANVAAAGSPATTPATRAPTAPAGAAAPPAAGPAGAQAAPGSAPPTPLVAQSFQAQLPPVASAAATYAAARGPAVPGAPAAAASPAAPGTPVAPNASPAPVPGTPPVTRPGQSPQPGALPPAPAGTAAPALQPAAAGTPVQLRLIGPESAAAAPQAGNQIAGTLIGYAPGGQAVIDTPLGRLALPLPQGAVHPDAGSRLLFELLGLGGRASSAAAAAAGTLPTLGREWPALKAAMTAIADLDLPLARQILEINMPRLGSPRFLGQVLHHLASSASGDARALLGDTAVALLERAGRGDVLARLDAELREMNRLNTSNSDWRVFWLPMLDASELRQLRVFTRRRKGGGDKERDGGRFIVEAEFDELGPMQIDGLVKKPRIDVILRSHVELPPGMQAGIAEVFGRTCDASGLIGKIFFHAAASFPVSPLDEIARAGPGLSV